ncbi:MAG: helix-turn-helix transcriptional regulator [Clostridia bacterium]|nr:helix-turn-helix transcriptional regulator [Clostridia bacterium]
MHLLTDFHTEDIQAFENGEKQITKAFLTAFVLPYKLPKKIVSLGHTPKQDIANALAHRLIELRTKEDFTQEVFAAMIGVSRSTYAAYEKGRNEPDIHTLIKIADIYGVSLDYLVGRY